MPKVTLEFHGEADQWVAHSLYNDGVIMAVGIAKTPLNAMTMLADELSNNSVKIIEQITKEKDDAKQKEISSS